MDGIGNCAAHHCGHSNCHICALKTTWASFFSLSSPSSLLNNFVALAHFGLCGGRLTANSVKRCGGWIHLAKDKVSLSSCYATASLSDYISNLPVEQAIRSGQIFSLLYIGIMLPKLKVRLIRFEKNPRLQCQNSSTGKCWKTTALTTLPIVVRVSGIHSVSRGCH